MASITASCDKCGYTLYFNIRSGKTWVIKSLRSDGWKFGKQSCICPKCSSKLK